MSGEIVVPETPNWLQELEAKREKRVKARLGHEAGAGAPCLKCADKCPGLDLHFWRKCCKICKCSKEEHEVQDDDIYGWAQFQLLGSKPNKIKRKIILPGKNDEIDLEWVPTGHNDTVDKYLKTLPPEQLPVKGSQAAQDRKQLLQKQIPIHDIDPTLCHELTEDELKQMNEYIAHVKQNSAGVGQIVSLSSIIKGKLHMLNPAEAAILSSRYGKGVPMSEIVKLHAQNKSGLLSHSLEKMSLKNKNLPIFNPNSINQNEDNLNPISSTKIHDRDYPLYSTDINRTTPNAQFSSSLGPKQIKTTPSNISGIDPNIDSKYLQNPNFDPKNRPSHFVHPSSQHNQDSSSFNRNPLDYNSENSAFVPYQNVSSVTKSGNPLLDDNVLTDPNYAINLVGYNKYQNNNSNSLIGNIPNYQSLDNNDQIYENLQDLRTTTGLPNYVPGKYNTHTETQSPTRIPKNVKDLAFSTYDSNRIDPNEIQNQDNGFKFGKYRQPGSYSEEMPKNSNGFRPIEAGNNGNSNSTLNRHPGNLVSGGIIGETARFESYNPNSQLSNSLEGKSGGNPLHSVQLHHKAQSNMHPGLDPSKLGSSKSPSSKAGEFRAPGFNIEQTGLHNAQFDPNTLNSKSSIAPGDMKSNNTHPGASFEDGGVPKYGDSFIPSSDTASVLRSGDNDIYGPQFNEDPSQKNTFGRGSTNSPFKQHPSDTASVLRRGDNDKYGPQFNEDLSQKNTFGRGSTNSPFKQHPSDTASALRRGDNDIYGTQFNEDPSQKNTFGRGSTNSPFKQHPSDTASVLRCGDNDKYGPQFNEYPSQENTFGRGSTNSPFKQHPSDTASVLRRGDNDKYGPQFNEYPSQENTFGRGSTNSPFKQHPSDTASVLRRGDNDKYGPQFNEYPSQENTFGRGSTNSPFKQGNKLSELVPNDSRVSEDFLNPSHVNIGLIQDIHYPDIKTATHEVGDFYEEYSPDSIKEILNNVILPDCHYCKKPFEENEFAVTIDRAEVLFHAGCFKCAGCNQILADNVYFYNKETDNVYCLRDYAKIRGFPRCKACDELIFTKEYCLAENCTFHLKHFCCTECDMPLAGQDYTLEGEMPYCLPCFEQNKASKCNACGKVIKPDEVGCTLKGIHFHVDDACFACKVCKTPLMGKKLLLRNDKLYCSHDCHGADQ